MQPFTYPTRRSTSSPWLHRPNSPLSSLQSDVTKLLPSICRQYHKTSYVYGNQRHSAAMAPKQEGITGRSRRHLNCSHGMWDSTLCIERVPVPTPHCGRIPMGIRTNLIRLATIWFQSNSPLSIFKFGLGSGSGAMLWKGGAVLGLSRPFAIHHFSRAQEISKYYMSLHCGRWSLAWRSFSPIYNSVQKAEGERKKVLF